MAFINDRGQLGERGGRRQNKKERKRKPKVWYERGESHWGSQWTGHGLGNTLTVGLELAWSYNFATIILFSLLRNT